MRTAGADSPARRMVRMVRMVRRLAETLGLHERRCAACLVPFSPAKTVPSRTASPAAHMLHAASQYFCPDCAAALLAPRPRCAQCGRVLPDGSVLCGECLAHPREWDTLETIGLYTATLRDTLLRAKFQADAASIRALGHLLAACCERFSEAPITAVVPIPLHKNRLRQRGFNLCQELAKPVAQALHAPIREDWLFRTRNTPSQRDLSGAARRQNMHGAFQAVPMPHARILLVEDVLTTGSTLEAAAKALRTAGADWIGVAVAARD